MAAAVRRCLPYVALLALLLAAIGCDGAWKKASGGAAAGAGSKISVEELERLDKLVKETQAKRRQAAEEVVPAEVESHQAPVEEVEFSKASFGDAEIFSKSLIFLVEPWRRSTSPLAAMLVGDAAISSDEPVDGITTEPNHVFTVYAYGTASDDAPPRHLDGIQLIRNDTWAGLERFGKAALRELHGVELRAPLLSRATLVEAPRVRVENAAIARPYDVAGVHKWFARRADVVLLGFQSDRLDFGLDMSAALRELDHQHSALHVFIDARTGDTLETLIDAQRRVVWHIAPHLFGAVEPPKVYLTNFGGATLQSLWLDALCAEQERRLLTALGSQLDERFRNRHAHAFERALKVRSHALLVDRFVDTYLSHKSLFASNRHLEKEISSYPNKYSIVESVVRRHNLSESDVPQEAELALYKAFFGVFPISSFSTLKASCSFLSGCPFDQLKFAVRFDYAEVLDKYERKLPVCKRNAEDCDTLDDRFEVRYKAKSKKQAH